MADGGATRRAASALRLKMLPVLRRLGGRATAGDVAAESGLPLAEVTEEMWLLVGDLRGHVDVDEKGDFVFKLPPSLRRPTDPERRLAMWRALYSAFKLVFKVCILMVLSIYVGLFALIAVLLMLAAIAAALSGNDSDSSDSGSWFPTSLLDWSWSSDSAASDFSRWERNRVITPVTAPQKGPSKKPWDAVFAYVFGDEDPPPDADATERAVLSYIRGHRGLLTATEIAAMTGADLDEASREAAQLAREHCGSLELTDKGALLYRFEQLAVSADGQAATARWRPCWDAPEPVLEADSNDTFVNFVIVVGNTFNLLWSGWFALSPSGLSDTFTYISVNLFDGGSVDAGFWPRLLLGWAPFIFSATFAGIRIARKAWIAHENRLRVARNQWFVVVERIFTRSVWQSGQPVTPSTLEGIAPEEQWLQRAVQAFQGVTIPGFSEKGYIFPRLREETADVEEARKGVDVARQRIGRITFATDDQPTVHA